MAEGLELRTTTLGDLDDLQRLYREAFPDEDLFPLVNDLLSGTAPLISFVAITNGRVSGHVIFTFCSIEPGNVAAALLGPLCATPDLQKTGIGSALVRAGFDQLASRNLAQVMVLGDPGYYGRFGFKPDHAVATPCPIPDEWKDAWQSIRLDGADRTASGKLVVPDAWLDPALWSA